MRALAASRCDPYARALFESLLGRNKARLQALIAVARKLLQAICGMFRGGLKYKGTKLFPRTNLYGHGLFLIGRGIVTKSLVLHRGAGRCLIEGSLRSLPA
jgi:hypothetical protein